MWKQKWELWIYVAMLGLANIGLLWGSVATDWYFYPEQVMAGQWHRLFTHAFVHVSWYHLLLDGSAFLMLYTMLKQPSRIAKTLYVLGANLGCVVGVTAVLPAQGSMGYAGLSGVAHGLMAVWALECILEDRDKTVKRIGWITLFLVLGKALFEACDGGVFFSFMHGHLMGHPIGISHLSGILGASVAYALCQAKIRPRQELKFTFPISSSGHLGIAPQSLNPQRSTTTPVVSLNRRVPISPKSERPMHTLFLDGA